MIQVPKVIVLDGATGVGKTSLLLDIRTRYINSIRVGKKLTTRTIRSSDNDWEFQFVDHIPKIYLPYSFVSVGNEYAINYEELTKVIRDGMIYAISCVDKHVIELLKKDFNAVVIYVYRAWSALELEKLLVERGVANEVDSIFRRQEMSSILADYLAKLDLYNHTILNIGTYNDMVEQLVRILAFYGITCDNSR